MAARDEYVLSFGGYWVAVPVATVRGQVGNCSNLASSSENGIVTREYSSENERGKGAYSSDEGNKLRSRDEGFPNIKDLRSTVILLSSMYRKAN